MARRQSAGLHAFPARALPLALYEFTGTRTRDWLVAQEYIPWFTDPGWQLWRDAIQATLMACFLRWHAGALRRVELKTDDALALPPELGPTGF